MKYPRIVLAAMVILCLPVIAQSTPTPLLVDNFDAATVGTIPAGWRIAKAVAGTSALTQAGTPAGNKWLVIHDDNGPGVVTSNTVSRTASFTPVTGTDRCTAQFDVMLSQITAGFGMRLTNGDVATTLSNCATSITFEGNVAYAPNGAPGAVSYQTGTQVYVRSPLLPTYAAGTWYTVRVEANVGSKMYKLFFGPRGGTLAEITPTGGIPFLYSATGTQVTQIANISFFTSVKDGDGPGDMTIDNVSILLGDPEPTTMVNTIAMARLLDRGTKISLTDKLVTAGTSNGVFYIEDDGVGVKRAAGIRVRSATPVQENDRVDVIGRIANTSEARGTWHTGEREIIAESVSVRSSGNTPLEPFLMRCSDVGGGWYGPMEITTDGPEPAIKAVWPFNAWGDSGVSSWSPPYGPLNNTGLLVTVIGKIIDPTVYDMYGTNYDFYIDDGSLANDGWFATPTPDEEAFKPTGLRVRITDPSILNKVLPIYHGDQVKITGIVGAISCEDLGRATIRNIRVVRPRKPEDIEIISRQERYVKFDKHGNCLVGGRPFFPIGIFIYAWDSLVRPEVLAKQFNTVIYAVTPDQLDSLQADGLMTIPYATEEWLAHKDHPAILAWYLDDEPEGHGLTPQYERDYYERTRAADPTRPIGTAHFLWDSLWNFRMCDDYTMSDVYPLHRMNIWSMTDHIDRLHQIHGQGFPVWPAIQSFGGTEGYGIPSPTEERCMTYMALAHNSKAILYFSYYPSLTETWAEVGRLVQELKTFTPFYCLPSEEPALGNTNSLIHTRLIKNGASGLIITVNISGEAQTATFTIPAPAPGTLDLPLEGGSIPLTDGSFTADFTPLQVHVYQWGPIPTMP